MTNRWPRKRRRKERKIISSRAKSRRPRFCERFALRLSVIIVDKQCSGGGAPRLSFIICVVGPRSESIRLLLSCVQRRQTGGSHTGAAPADFAACRSDDEFSRARFCHGTYAPHGSHCTNGCRRRGAAAPPVHGKPHTHRKSRRGLCRSSVRRVSGSVSTLAHIRTDQTGTVRPCWRAGPICGTPFK